MLQKKPHYFNAVLIIFLMGQESPCGHLGRVLVLHFYLILWNHSEHQALTANQNHSVSQAWAFSLSVSLQTQLKISIWWLWWNAADSLLGRQQEKEIKKTNSKGHEGRLGHRKPGRVTVSYLLLVHFFWDPALRGVCTLILEKHPVVHCTLFQTTTEGFCRECSDFLIYNFAWISGWPGVLWERNAVRKTHRGLSVSQQIRSFCSNKAGSYPEKRKNKKGGGKKGKKKASQWSSNTTVCFALRFVPSTIQLAGFAVVLPESRLINGWISGAGNADANFTGSSYKSAL